LRIQANEVDYIDFDDGSEIIEEGTWSLPKTAQQMQDLQTLLANPLPVGVDAENATGALYDLLGDDDLFNSLSDLAEISGPKADARDAIKQYIKNDLPGLYTKLGLDDSTIDQDPTQQQQPGQPPQAGAPATAEPQDPNAGTTGGTGMDSPAGANTAQESVDRLVRLAGIKSILIK